jgi:hypothetical protein
MNYNSCVDKRVKSNSFGSPDSPPQQWVSEHAIDEECRQVPEPRQLNVDSWECLLHEIPVVILNFIIWSSEIFVLLTKIKSWDQENENGNYEWDQQPQYFVTDIDSEMLVLSSKKGGSDSRNIEEHRNTYLHEGLDDTVFLLLDSWDVFSIQITGIEGVD